MAVYGDMLSFFPEQFQAFEYFSMDPNPVAGYDKRTPLGYVRAVLQYSKRGELTREGDALTELDVPILWTRKKLEIGNYIIADDEMFRLTDHYPWFFQGGYYCYYLQTMSGSTDEQTKDPDVNIGQGWYV